MRIFIIGLVAVVVGVGNQAVSQKPKDPTEIIARYLKVRLGQSERTAPPGGRITLSVDVTPAPTIHVYAPGQIGSIAIKLQPSSDFKAAPARYPPSVPYFFAPTNETFKVYNTPFQITQTITLAATAKLRQRAAAKEPLVIPGKIEYQACDDLVCYRPDFLDVSWKLELTPGTR
jgi:DsbC/DsbD-like thiol-disulfide interchange protein